MVHTNVGVRMHVGEDLELGGLDEVSDEEGVLLVLVHAEGLTDPLGLLNEDCTLDAMLPSQAHGPPIQQAHLSGLLDCQCGCHDDVMGVG